MEYRRLVGSDLEDLFKIRMEAVAVAPTAFGATLAEVKARGSGDYAAVLESSDDDHAIFGAFKDRRLVGMVGIMRPTRPKTRHRASIWGMFVGLQEQGQGVGGELLDIAIRHAKERMRADVVYLNVESGNLSAIRLYESRSFRAWGREPKALFFDGRFFDETHLTLDLTGVSGS